MGSLKDFSGELAGLVSRASQSVVRVDARRGRGGSGLVWDTALVVTADHVIEQAENITVVADSREFKAALVGRDPSTDLALLKVDGLSATAASRGRPSDLKIGHLVLALGRPGELHATMGVVSSLKASIRRWHGGQIENLIQTDAELLPGFSGGPLLDAEGLVVGINSWHLGRGISRALAIDLVDRVVQKLKTDGRVKRAYLGVGTHPVRLAEPVRARLNQEDGLLVVAVEPQGPADKAGLLQGDTLTRLNGEPIGGLEGLFSALRKLEVGSTHTLTVVRAGDVRELPVTVGERAP